MKIEVITVSEEIKIIGLSYRKLGLPSTIESLEKIWNMYNEKYRNNVKNAVIPLMDYGVNDCLLTDTHEYFAGCAVTEIGKLDENWASFVAPKGKYIKHTSHNRAELHSTDIKAWAKANGLKFDENFMLEVYPNGELNEKNVEEFTLRLMQSES